MSILTSDQERQIREFTNANQLIQAIKLYREITGLGLAEAKSAVEAIARGESVNFSVSAPQTQFDDPLLETKIKDLLIKRNKIEAIKIYRLAHNVGLKEAKDVVDGIEATMSRERSTMSTLTPSNPVVSDDPFAGDAASNRMRLVIIMVVFLLLGLCGLATFFFLRGSGF